MTTRKVQSRQPWKPPKAADENAKAAAADTYRRGQERLPEKQRPVDGDVIIIRNDSGGRLREGDVMGLGVANTKILTAVERDKIWCIADKLTNCLPNCQVVVLLEPVESTKFALAQISGRGVAYVNVGAVWHRRARPTKAADVLVSGLFGPLEILRTPDGTGEKLCYVSIGHSDNRGVFAEVQPGGISAGSYRKGKLRLGSGTVRIVDATSVLATYQEQAAKQLTAYNAECTGFTEGEIIELHPSDDWLPLAEFLCDPGSESSSDSSSSDSSDSDSSDSDSSDSDSSDSDSSDSDSSDSDSSDSDSSDSDSSDSDSSVVIDETCYCQFYCDPGTGYTWRASGSPCGNPLICPDTIPCGADYPIWGTPCEVPYALTYTNCLSSV